MLTKERWEHFVCNIVFLTDGQAYEERSANITRNLTTGGLHAVFVQPGERLGLSTGSVITGGGFADLLGNIESAFSFSIVNQQTYFSWAGERI